jgi:phosphinothricin acetyltransferase
MVLEGLVNSVTISIESKFSSVLLRMATEADARELLSIYAPYVMRTPITFETEIPSEKELRRRIVQTLSVAPWLVCIKDDVIAGFAYANKHHERQAYAWSCNVSVYIAEEFHRQGLGRALYTELFSRLKEQGFCNVFAGITLPNSNSVGLHSSMGFKHIGTYESVGFKMNKWHDVSWWQKQLVCCDAKPATIRSPQQMNWL